jgi:hypothetical protein
MSKIWRWISPRDAVELLCFAKISKRDKYRNRCAQNCIEWRRISKNRRTEVTPSFRACTDLYPYIRYLFYDVGGVWHKRSPHNSVKHLWFSWKSSHGWPYFSYGSRQNHVYMCTVKGCDILKVLREWVHFLLRIKLPYLFQMYLLVKELNT